MHFYTLIYPQNTLLLTCVVTQEMTQEHPTAQQQNKSPFLCFPERLLRK